MKNYKRITCSGAVGIPVDMRRSMGFQKGDPVEVEIINDEIIIRPYKPRCVFCESQKQIHKYKNRWICDACIKLLNSQEQKRNAGTN